MNLIKLLPLEKFVLTTRLPVEEISRRLTDNVVQKSYPASSVSKQKLTMQYRGQVLGNTFSISRIINYRNSFLPVITGEITAGYGQTLITVKMRPAVGVLIFMSIWLGGVGLVCLMITLAAIIQIKKVFQGGFSPAALIPFGMFLFGFLLIALGFKAEASQSKDFLLKLFEAQAAA